ncbi:MAG: DUF86 domain-containing protein [Thermomicrobiales bacterium]
MDEETYCAEDGWLVRAGVERFIITAAEALMWLRHHEPQTFAAIPDGAKAIALRNIIVHQYKHVDDAVIWRAVSESLRELRAQVRAIRGEVARSDGEDLA